MDRRTLLAITLCFLIYMGWQKYYLEPRLPTTNVSQITNQKPEQQPITTTQNAAPEEEASAPAPELTHKRPTQTLALETPTGQAAVGDGADIFADWSLKNYHEGVSNSTASVNLPYVTHQNGEMSLAFDDPAYAYLNDIQGRPERQADSPGFYRGRKELPGRQPHRDLQEEAAQIRIRLADDASRQERLR